jgi:hypothetical protein
LRAFSVIATLTACQYRGEVLEETFVQAILYVESFIGDRGISLNKALKVKKKSLLTISAKHKEMSKRETNVVISLGFLKAGGAVRKMCVSQADDIARI